MTEPMSAERRRQIELLASLHTYDRVPGAVNDLLAELDRVTAQKQEALEVAKGSWINLDADMPEVGGLWVNQEDIVDALTGSDPVVTPIWIEGFWEQKARADRAEAALARVTDDSMTAPLMQVLLDTWIESDHDPVAETCATAMLSAVRAAAATALRPDDV